MRELDLGAYDDSLTGVTVSGSRLVQDSRIVSTGDIFVALAPEFVSEAIERGASAVLAEAPAPNGAYGIPGLAHQLGRIADDFSGHASHVFSLVGVTGTNGKTSVVQLLGQAWQLLGRRAATVGTLGASIVGQPPVATGLTTPPVTLVHEFFSGFRDAGVTDVAIEVSSHALEQGRVAGADFEVVVFTNLTRDHLDYHGTMERYAAAKARVFSLPGEPIAVINVDDEYGAGFFAGVPAGRRIGLSSAGHPDATVSASDVRLGLGELEFTLEIEGKRFSISSPLIGRFNVDNLLACAGVLLAQGVAVDEIVSAIRSLAPVFGRMNRIQPDPSLPLVIVDYAHTPDAISQSLAALADYDYERVITVFGCTGDRDRGKRPEMARIVEAGSDVVIVTDDDVHHEDGDRILDEIRVGFANPSAVVEIRDRGTAIARAISEAGPRDVVLIAGKGHESYLVVGDEHIPFSDTETAERLLHERLLR